MSLRAHDFPEKTLEHLFEALRIFQAIIPDSHVEVGMCESNMMTLSVHVSFCSAF